MTRTALLFALFALAACRGGDTPRSSANATPAPAGSASTTAGAPGSAASSPLPAAAGSAAAIDPWADNGPRALPPPKVTRPFERPFVWSATRGGKTMYLFGTLHGGVDAEKRIPLWVWKHFDEATTLVEEANLQDLEIVKWTVRPDGPTLRAELGEEYWGKLESILTPRGAGFLDTQATPVATLRVSGHGGGGRDLAGPMDGELLVRAQGLKKQIVFLETGAFQGDLFGALYGADTLRRLIDRRDELKTLNPRFIDAYVDGDGERLLELSRAMFRLGVPGDADLEAFWGRLLVERNRRWIATLEAQHAKDGTVFVAVGALHFLGSDNVVDLLRARGFSVERMTAPSP